jgi:hypothetical protein
VYVCVWVGVGVSGCGFVCVFVCFGEERGNMKRLGPISILQH